MISNHYRVIFVSIILSLSSVLCNVHISTLPLSSLIYMYNFRFHICVHPPFFYIEVYNLSLYFTCHEEDEEERKT